MKITLQHHQAINYLLQGHTGKETAAMLSVAPETVSKWRNDCDFQALVNHHLQDTRDAVQTKLRHLSTLALVTHWKN